MNEKFRIVEIKEKGEVFYIIKTPWGFDANDCKHKTKESAEKHLEIIKAFS